MNPQTKPRIILASNSIGRKQLLEKLGVPFTVMPSNIDEDSITGSDHYETLKLRARAKAENIIQHIPNLLKVATPTPRGSPLRSPPGSLNSFKMTDDGYIASSACLPARQVKRMENNLPLTSLSKGESLRTKPFTLYAKPYLIIAADSEAILDGKTYGKSKDKSHAREIVQALMGKTHEFVTATSIILLKEHKSLKSPKILRESKRWEHLTTTSVTLRTLDASSLDAYISSYDFTRFAAGYALNETPWDLVTKIDGSVTNVIGLPFEVILPIFSKLNLF